MRYSNILIFTVLTASAFTLVAMSSRSPKQKRELPATDAIAANTELQARVGALESEFGTLRTLTLRGPTPQPSASSAAAPPPEADKAVAAAGPPQITPEEHDRRLVEDTLTSFEATFASEARDPNWERQSAKALGPVFAGPELAASKVSSVDCVHSLCKIVIQHRDAGARADFAELAHRVLAPFNAPAFIRYSPETNETFFYVAREGEPLPMVPSG